MTPQEHYVEAEKLLEEGRRQVAVIAKLSSERLAITSSKPAGELGSLGPYDRAKVKSLTRRMNEKGKKCQGIWAQAQVHATLSLGPGEPYVPAILTETPF